MTHELSALIFDVDGTLAETEEAHRLAFNQVFAEYDLPWSWDLALYKELLAVSGGKERILAYVQRFHPDRLGPDLDELIPVLHKRKTAIYTERVAAGSVPLRPGVAEIVAQAREAGLRLAVATTTSRANVLALIDGATGGAGHEWFEVMGCAEDAPVKKPDPQVYHYVLDKMGLAPESCLAIEDSSNGIRAATAARVPVVVTLSDYTEADNAAAALAVYPDLGGVTLADLRGLHARRG